MSLIPKLKSLLQGIPEPVGAAIARVPYRVRPGIGRPYRACLSQIGAFQGMDSASREQYVVERVRSAVEAAARVPFYRELYRSHGFRLEHIRTVADIALIPIVTKAMLRNTPLEGRSHQVVGRYKVNTGGSSGAALDLYITPRHIPVEWAHMHTVWSKLGYRQHDLKLGLGGRNLGDTSIAYDGLRHQISLSVYRDYSLARAALETVSRTGRLRYLHGYPSALANFADWCQEEAPDILPGLRRSLRGAFLGSEYPAEIYRAKIEGVFGVPSVSWYGHTERAILAWEKHEKFLYYPFQTYGYCEAVADETNGGYKLVGTSYTNDASPMVRYDTDDDIEPVEVDGHILQSFRVRAGRVGEVVLDRKGQRIPLTGLIFGRHHRLFDIAKFVQVRQATAGQMTVVAVMKGEIPAGFRFEEWFDATGIDMAVSFEVAERPLLAPSGKVMLLLR